MQTRFRDAQHRWGTSGAAAVALLTLVAALPAGARAQSGADRPDAAAGKEERAPVEPPPLVALPELLEHVVAEYPPEALAAGIEGVVRLELIVDETGAVTELRVVESAGHGFDEAAVAAVQQFRFAPARTAEGPVPVRILYEYGFTARAPGEDGSPTAGEGRGPRGDDTGAPGAGARRGPSGDDAGTPAAGGDPGSTGDATAETEARAGGGAVDGELTGKVLEAGSRLPLAGVPLVLDETEARVVTGADGAFSFGALPPGDYTAVVVTPGFERLSSTERVEGGKRTEVTYYLRPLVRGGGFETVVRTKREKKEVTVYTIRREEVAKAPGTFGDPVRVVQNLPGVARAPFGVGLIAVRGAAPADTGVYVDGHGVPLLFHFLGGPSVLPFEIVDAVDFYPGGTGPRFGNHAAGIIEVRTRPGRTERIFAQADVDLLDAGFILEGPAGEHGSFVVGGRKSYMELWLPAVIPEDEGEDLTVTPSYWDYQARYDWREGDTSLGVLVFGSHDKLSFLREPERKGAADTDAFGMRNTWHRVIGRWEQKLGDDADLVLSPAVGYDWSDVEGNALGFDLKQVSATLRSEVSWRAARWLSLAAGVEAGYYYGDIAAALPINWEGLNFPAPNLAEGEAKVIALDASSYRAAPYVELAWKPSDDLTVLPGVLFDYSWFDEVELTAVDPRLTVRYRLDERFTLKTNVGLFSQWPFMPAMVQNKSLGMEHALQGTVGAEASLPFELTADVQVFGKYLYDLVVFDDSQAMSGEMSAMPLRNAGEGRAWGAEVLLRRRLADGVFGWLSYTFQRAERLEPGADWYRYDYDQTHILTVIGSWEILRGWTAGMRFRYVTGNPTTPVVDAVFDADSGRYRAVRGPRNSDRLPDFHQLDVRIDREFTFDTWYLSVYLDVQNVYNRRNAESYDYSFDYSKRVIFPGLPILPTIGIKGEL